MSVQKAIALREDGNELFRKSCEASKNISDADGMHDHRSKLQAANNLMECALRKYEKAIHEIPANNTDQELELQLALLSKNAASTLEWMCNFKHQLKMLQKKASRTSASARTVSTVDESILKCIKYTAKAVVHGILSEKDTAWIQGQAQKLSDRLLGYARSGNPGSFFAGCDDSYSDFCRRVAQLMPILQEFPRDHQRLQLAAGAYNMQVAISFFHEIVHCEESISASKHAFDDPSAATMDNVVDAAEKLESSRYHLLEARRVAPKQRPNPLVPEHCVPVDELERDLYRYECIINGRKQQCISSRHLRDVVFDAEDLDLQRTWDGVDMLHVALSEVKGQDIPLEAELLSNIGQVFHRVLKMDDKAKHYFQTCLSTALTCPQNFNNRGWFQTARKAIQQFQSKTVEDEELQRGPILEALEPELKALNKAAADNWQALVKHCYSKHPPKISPPYQLDPDVKLTADNGKKTLKQAIIHYHPDKNVEQDVKW
eukprot:CAMPEP_0114238878 /NCGR_PEP_ID=MMETSP0058-20121206/8155_1 /TAXON_ID=36894 /ORGANISM="Pyramimonas parkeae, CCMP726" /LENGTH=487 /DNA_ID=CAMNT_0001351009 /DNA_START=155 /DNA_END=1615 /DNA_ORIENTATION=-